MYNIVRVGQVVCHHTCECEACENSHGESKASVRICEFILNLTTTENFCCYSVTFYFYPNTKILWARSTLLMSSWAFLSSPLLDGYTCIHGNAILAIALLGAAISLAYLKSPSRCFPTSEEIKKGVDLAGKVVLVTGAMSGISVKTVWVLALRGAHVIIAGRNASNLETTKKQLIVELPLDSNKVDTVVCDLNDLQSGKHCANCVSLNREWRRQNRYLSEQCQNQGDTHPDRKKQRLESQVGVCHVGRFYLTKLLLPAIQKASGRVVCLSSSAHLRHDMQKCLVSPMLDTDPYHEWTAYGNTKACNMLHTKALSTLPDITAYSVMQVESIRASRVMSIGTRISSGSGPW